jgi:hypothetical protein
MNKRDIKKLGLNTQKVRRLSSEEMDDVAGGRRSQTATCGTADDMCLCRICTWG